MIALIVYGAINLDPATIVIVVVLAIFFGVPALLLIRLNRRRRGSDSPVSPYDETPR